MWTTNLKLNSPKSSEIGVVHRGPSRGKQIVHTTDLLQALDGYLIEQLGLLCRSLKCRQINLEDFLYPVGVVEQLGDGNDV